MPKSSSIPSHASPSNLGYRMPAEWEPHEGTWLSWPHNADTWPGGGLDRVCDTFARIVTALVDGEEVHINVNDAAQEHSVRRRLGKQIERRTIFHHFPTNDAWCRDYGALFVRNLDRDSRTPPLVAINWGFNSWGEKYPPYDLDDVVPMQMAHTLEVPCVSGGMILEGGSIDVNGTGLLLTTESCLLNPNRNPDLSRQQIEQRLAAMLGVEEVLWLAAGIVGDDTDGHIDDVARFVSAHTVVTAVEDNPQDANYAVLQENLRRLQKVRCQEGKSLRIVTLPMPCPVGGNHRMPASYLNFYMANKTVLVPQFRQAADQEALRIVTDLFPERHIIGIDCVELIGGFGAIHCVTQQIPATE
jgi:agmatine deiminase